MRQTYKLLLSIVPIGLLASQLAACGAVPDAPAAAAAAQLATAVATPAAAETFANIDAIGEVKPIQDANLTFQVAGTVAQVLVKEGDTVKKDQLLAVLDTRVFDEKVSQAQAALQVAQAALQSAQATDNTFTRLVRSASQPTGMAMKQ